MSDFAVDMLPIEDVHEYVDNPRDNSKAVQKVVDSITTVGWRVPIVVDEDNVILAGHTRLKAARVMNLTRIPVHRALAKNGEPLTEEQKKAFRIMDNKSSEASEWDDALLVKEFMSLADMDFDLSLTGFDLDEINKLTKGAMLEFESPDLEILEGDWLGGDMHIPETNVKQFMLLYDIETIEEMKTMIEALREVYQIESPSDIIFRAVKLEYKNNTDL
jgi:hypothetical protein